VPLTGMGSHQENGLKSGIQPDAHGRTAPDHALMSDRGWLTQTIVAPLSTERIAPTVRERGWSQPPLAFWQKPAADHALLQWPS
jgi:hypothetical protein